VSDEELGRIARAARDRTLAEHTAHSRALDMERLFDATWSQHDLANHG